MFTPTYQFDCLWNGHRLRIGSVQPRNRAQISSSLKNMSAETIRNRFSGSKKEFTPKELEYLTVLDGFNHYAIGIEELEGAQRGVGLIRMVRSEQYPMEAEIAIALIDGYQKMGLGKILMKLMILAALERKIERLSFTFLPNNTAIIKLIQSSGKATLSPGSFVHTHMYLDLKTIDANQLRQELKNQLPNFCHC